MKERVKDLTIAAHNYIKSEAVAPENMQLAYGDFVNGAKWAFEYMEKNRLTACDNMTEEEAEREQRFAINFLKENDRVPTYSDAIEITRKEMIDKACEWLQEHKNDYAFPIYQGEELTDESYVSDDIIKDLRKAMKGE